MSRRRRERCSFIFGCDLGDPISSICLNEHGCMAGTMLGKVLVYGADAKAKTMTEFSDEGVRGLHLEEEYGFVTFADHCKGWKLAYPHVNCGSTNFRSLDKKNTQSVRHVLQHGPWACVLFPISTTVVNVTRQEHFHRPFKLWDYGRAGNTCDIAPCDFDGESLLVVDRSPAGAGVFRVVHLESDTVVEIDDIPGAKTINLARFWSNSCLVCSGGSTPFLYDYQSKDVLRTLRGHQSEVVAMDTQDPDRIATLSDDAVVKVWIGATGSCSHTFFIPEASFFLGYPYFLSMQDRRILASADEGAFLIEYGEE